MLGNVVFMGGRKNIVIYLVIFCHIHWRIFHLSCRLTLSWSSFSVFSIYLDVTELWTLLYEETEAEFWVCTANKWQCQNLKQIYLNFDTFSLQIYALRVAPGIRSDQKVPSEYSEIPEFHWHQSFGSGDPVLKLMRHFSWGYGGKPKLTVL